MKKFIILLIVLLTLGSVIVFAITRIPVATLSKQIPIYTVTPRSFSASIKAIGTLEAISSKVITAPYSAKIVKLIPEGTFVEENDPVIWFDTTELEDEKQELETEIKLAESRLAQLEEELHLLKTKQEMSIQSQKERIKYQEVVYNDAYLTYETEKQLVERNLAPRSRLDEAKLALLQAELSLTQEKINLTKMEETNRSQLVSQKAEIAKAHIELEHRQNRMDQTLRRLDKAILRAPGSGYVIYQQIWKGGSMDKPAEGDQVHSRYTLAQIPDSSTMLAVVPVNELDIGQVEPGLRAHVIVESFPDKVFEGEIVSKSIVPVSDTLGRFGFSQGSAAKEFEVKAKILENDERLRPGMTAIVEIIVMEKSDAIVVPVTAIKEIDGKRIVFKKEQHSSTPVEVSLGLMNESFAEVTQGLKVGDQIYLRDPGKEIQVIGAGKETRSPERQGSLPQGLSG